MKRIKKNIPKILKLLLPIYIILNILYVFIGSYLYETKSLTYKNFSIGYIVVLFLNILVILGIIFYKIKTKKKANLNIIDALLLLIVLFSFISAIFAKRANVALYGMPGRYEGLYQICSYLSMFMLTTFIDKKYKKLIASIIIGVAAIEAFYAYFQVMNVFNIARTWHYNVYWATGFTMNPNFFASLIVLGLSFTIGLFIESKKLDQKVLLGALLFILMTGLLISNTMSAVVGMIVVLIYSLIYTIIKKKLLNYIIIIILLIFPTILVVSINKTTLFEDIITTKNETTEIIKGNIDGDYGTNRMYIWTRTLEIVPKNIIHGVGIDNFYFAFGDKPIGRKQWFFDKAHNEYLQILICEGIFSLLSYLAFFAVIVIRAIKESYKENTIYLLLPVLGYLAQAFFNISVIEVAPLFYITLGLCVTRKPSKKLEIFNN